MKKMKLLEFLVFHLLQHIIFLGGVFFINFPCKCMHLYPGISACTYIRGALICGVTGYVY